MWIFSSTNWDLKFLIWRFLVLQLMQLRMQLRLQLHLGQGP